MYKILLVEDERETANFVKQALELEDMEVETAYDGQEGLDLFRANEYDLLLLDYEMPRMNGEDLVRQVRKENPYIDIIVYTNYKDFNLAKKMMNLGVNGYVNKGPESDLQELVDMVKQKLEPLDDEDISLLIRNTDEI
ncbi:MAG: response regulator [Lachnospiraceae bacterium]|nr:response regulator [Lachnospiraceae bacterium]